MGGCRHPCRQSGTKRDMQVIGTLHDDAPKCIFLRYKVSPKVSPSLPLLLLLSPPASRLDLYLMEILARLSLQI
jgi:hypothetical protein